MMVKNTKEKIPAGFLPNSTVISQRKKKEKEKMFQ